MRLRLSGTSEGLMATEYDRKAEDLGNVVLLEHVNLQIPDQGMATSFCISGLGLTRDPYLNTGIRNLWINVGKAQFHLPTGDPWVLRGTIGLVMPDRAAARSVRRREERARRQQIQVHRA
jgi:hypothetical protein